MANNISALTGFLKENVQPMLLDAINLRSVERQIFGEIKKSSVDGVYYREDTITKGNFRLEGRAERGTLPGFNSSTYAGDVPAPLGSVQVKHRRKYMYTSLDFTGQAAAAPLTSGGGYKNLSKLIMKQTMEGFPESISRQLATNQAGIRGQVAGVSSTTVTLDAANAPATSALAIPWAGNRFFREGEVFDAINMSTPGVLKALRQSDADDFARNVSAVSEDTTTATLTTTVAATSWDDGDLVVVHGGRATAAITDGATTTEAGFYNAQGIMDAVQNSSDPHYALTYYGELDATAAANRIFQSKILINTTPEPLNIQMMNRLLERIRIDSLGGDKPDCWYMHDSVYRFFIDNAGYTTMANFATNNPVRNVNPGKGFKPVVGVSGIEVNNIGANGSMTIYISPFAPTYRAYAISKKNLRMLVDKEMGVMDDDGLDIRQISGQDAWTMVFKWYCSGIVTDKRIAHGYIVGVTGDQNN